MRRSEVLIAALAAVLLIAGGIASASDADLERPWLGRADGQPFFAYVNVDHTHESNVWPTWRITSLTQLFMAPMRIVVSPPCRVLSCPLVKCRLVPCSVFSCLVVSCRVLSCRVVSLCCAPRV